MILGRRRVGRILAMRRAGGCSDGRLASERRRLLARVEYLCAVGAFCDVETESYALVIRDSRLLCYRGGRRRRGPLSTCTLEYSRVPLDVAGYIAGRPVARARSYI